MIVNQPSETHTVQSISDLLNGEVIGDQGIEVTAVAPIEDDRPNTITFFGHPRYERYLYGEEPRAILVGKDFEPKPSEHIAFIRVDNVYEAMSSLSGLFNPALTESEVRISTRAEIDPSVILGQGVSVGHFSVIASDTYVHDGVVIMDQVYVGRNVTIGPGTRLHQGVKIMDHVTIGAGCIIYPNAVIGSEGFGHTPTDNGYRKMNHHGSVVIEDDVEVGSNTCIDRGAVGDTIIRKGAKLDNLIQIAHGVEVGAHAALAAQVGISGSSKIGAGSQLGGQTGVVGHVKIAPQSKIQAQSGVAGDIKVPGKKWYGYPAISYFSYLRSFALFKRLPDIMARLRKLEDKD